MINLFKVGCNFDQSLITYADELNDQYKDKSKILEWFGSAPSHDDLTGRPKWRLPNISDKEFENFVKKAKDKGQVFNVVLNSIQPYGSKVEMYNHKQEIQDYVKYLEDIGVYRITVANPMMAMFIREVSNIEMEASCIMHIDTVTQLKYLHEQFGINKYCNSILKNRNKDFLVNAAKYCNDNNLILELLCTEFCGVAGEGYATHCPYRDSCYLSHATCKTKEDSMTYNNYPMKFCMSARASNKESWLRMRFIRPEDLHYYNEIGINYFKISGRTGGTENLMRMMKAYCEESFEGNLLNLWKPLQTIYNDKKEFEQDLENYIPNKSLDGFLDHWFDKNFECENQMCGVTCNYCHDFYMKNCVINLLK